jgi:hypothetical protein
VECSEIADSYWHGEGARPVASPAMPVTMKSRRSILMALAIAFIVFFAGSEIAHAGIEDWSHDFTSYTTGSLAGQGGWSTTTTNLEITSTGGFVKSVGNSSPSETTYKEIGYPLGTTTSYTYNFDAMVKATNTSRVYLKIETASTTICSGGINSGTFTDTVTATGYIVQTNTWYDLSLTYDPLTGECLFDYGTGEISRIALAGKNPTHLAMQVGGTLGQYAYLDNISVYEQYDVDDYYSSSSVIAIKEPLDGHTFVCDPDNDGDCSDGSEYVVLIEYDYYNDGTDYDQACLEVVDTRTFLTVSDSCITIGDTGGVVSRGGYYGLSVGTRYRWIPYLKHSSTSIEKRGVAGSGLYHTFNIYRGEDGQFTYNRSTGTDPFGYGTSSLGFSGFNISLATTTDAFCADYGNLCTKFPFAYMVDVVSAIAVFRDSANAGHAGVFYNYDDGFSSGTIALIDPNATGTVGTIYSAIATMRFWFDMGLWFLFGIWAFGLANRFV